MKEQAAAAGLDPDYLDKDFPDYRQYPEYNQIFEERKRGIAVDVLKQKMLERGLDDCVLDIYDMGDSQTIRVDYLKYIEWFRRKENGEDLNTICREMEQAGLDASVINHDVNNIEFINIPYSIIINGDSNGLHAQDNDFDSIDLSDIEVDIDGLVNQEKEDVPVSASTPIPTPATCPHKYTKWVDYKYYKQFNLMNKGIRTKEQLQMKMGMEGMDPSILDLDMNTVGFENIPDGKKVKYPDGHVEPCTKK